MCDGNPRLWYPHCNDGSDEDPVMCVRWNCTVGYWKCQDGLGCIEERDVCDGDHFFLDCNDGSDEDLVVCAELQFWVLEM